MTKDKRFRSHHQVLASVSRTAVLELLRERAEPLGVEQIAEQIGLHPNTVRSHLDLLVDAGYATRRTEPPQGPGRPRAIYEATTAPQDGSNYRLLAEVLARHLMATSADPAAAATQAGHDWATATAHAAGETGTAATTQEAIEQVVRLLADTGFAPELSAGHDQINLHHCPFRELAEANQEVVCGAHLGILQGAFAELGAPVAATRLLPLVQPDLCIATIESTATS